MASRLKEVIIIKKQLLILLIFFIVLVNGCTLDENNSKTLTPEDEGEFIGIVSEFELKIEDKIGVYNKENIIDEKLALEIGNSVLKSIYGEDMLTNSRFVVFEIENENIFVVSRLPKDTAVLGGEHSIAIRKTDGAILKIWAGE